MINDKSEKFKWSTQNIVTCSNMNLARGFSLLLSLTEERFELAATIGFFSLSFPPSEMIEQKSTDEHVNTNYVRGPLNSTPVT